MGDLISRQAAIDNLKRHLNETDVPDHYPGIFNAIEEWLSDWEVPYAQPEPCEDAVSRQAVINIINKPVIIKAKEQIEALPSAQPEIIMCKDCCHYPGEHTDCPLIGWGRNEKDFCSYAERKIDGRD